MDLTCLMVGDLVQTKKGEVIQVESISTRNKRKIGYLCDGILKYKKHSEVTPILLTPEIIESNGWSFYEEWYGKKWYKHNHFYFFLIISTKDYDKGFEVINQYDDGYLVCYCMFVHELQQAIRLCGFGNWANIELKSDEEEEHNLSEGSSEIQGFGERERYPNGGDGNT